MRAPFLFLASFLTALLFFPPLTFQTLSGARREEAAGFCNQEIEREDRSKRMDTSRLGGIKDSEHAANSLEIESLARFAIEEHNKKENGMMELVSVVEAEEQVVSGKLYHLTLDVIDAGKRKQYKAKVWVKPWMDFKELQEFNFVKDSCTITASDLGAKRDGPGTGLKSVPKDDPVVQEAAEHAVHAIQQRSNSLDTYELRDIVCPKAEVVNDSAKVHMLIKTKRGNAEEHFNVEVHKSSDGGFSLKSSEKIETQEN
ncbi:unnamed protein product [Cuscuta campestris]|uniref:Cysteine proteinase inhibitor n=1 Tax=Cuscuta campestris TaxID=132261 RepID=A0A484KJ43_9ASTE|nr:unnamed protein product [Cuscuta campestris]